MATAPQAAMEMPQEAAPNPFSDPNTMAVYDQMRQEISPQEFSNEILAGASQIDPQAVAAFTKELQGLDIPPEVLDALNDVVDEILASPDKYDELRKKYMDQGLPEEILPEQFDPQFFAALNMAIDQMIAAPTGVQAFAKGGIAELKPIAKAIASYGRNGDTMLAHITPAEARMLRRRGGSGTINPHTGLPEFFLKKLWQIAVAPIKLVAKAVQSFAKSSIGRIVLPIALGFFLGPAAAGLIGITSTVGVAAVSGFVGSSLSTLAAGGNLGQALKAGAMGGLTAGAGAGVFGGANAFASGSGAPVGTTAGQAVQGQVDAFKGMLPGGGPTGATALGGNYSDMNPAGTALDVNYSASGLDANKLAAVPTGGTELTNFNAAGSAPTPANVSQGDPFGDFMKQKPVGGAGANTAPAPAPAGAARSFGSAPAYTPGGTSVGDSFSKIGEGMGVGKGPASFSTFKEGVGDLFFPGPSSADLSARAQELMKANSSLSLKDAMTLAKDIAPTALRTYAPAAVAGLGAMSAFGGFKTEPVQPSAINQSLMTPVTQRIRQDGTQSQMYLQGMPGVRYDQYGEPTDGYRRLPTYDVPDYNAGGYGMYSASGQGIMDVPTVYNTPSGSIGSSRVEQPYNTASMYSNIMPRRYADGGEAATFDWNRYLEANTDLRRAGIDTEAKAKEHWFGSGLKEGRPMNPAEAVAKQQAEAAADASNLAARTKVAQDKAMRKAQGSGNMYANINAGLAALAPETFPGAPVTVSPERRAAMDAALKGTSTDIQKSRVMRDNAFRPEEMAAYANLGFGEVNRRYNTALRQDAYAPMLEEQRNSMNQQRNIAANVPTAPVKGEAVSQPPMGANPYSNITTPVAPPTSVPAPFFKPGDLNSPYYQGSLPPGSFPANGGNFDGYDFIYDAPLPEGMSGTMGGTGFDPVTGRSDLGTAGGSGQYVRRAEVPKKLMNMGGIAGLAAGGYPRRNGQINGPGTEKSDSIPAMLSDGEFVMTAKAVRGAGKGSRRAGAKKMYKLMHQLEKNSERG
tara:strand:- start:20143 stop:23217 length:3075 start_codon:yes stop_codon:yes gene_type:complete